MVDSGWLRTCQYHKPYPDPVTQPWASLSVCLSLPLSYLRPPWWSERGRRVRRGVEVASGAGGAGEARQPGNSTRAGSPEETAAQYAVIAIVPIFCLMGLLGILVCNLLKRKGYHCTAQKEVGPGPGGGGSGEAQPGVGWGGQRAQVGPA